MEIWALAGILLIVAAVCSKPEPEPGQSGGESDMQVDEEKERLYAEIARLKMKVRSNPWPWLAGGMLIGFAFGLFFH